MPQFVRQRIAAPPDVRVAVQKDLAEVALGRCEQHGFKATQGMLVDLLDVERPRDLEDGNWARHHSQLMVNLGRGPFRRGGGIIDRHAVKCDVRHVPDAGDGRLRSCRR